MTKRDRKKRELQSIIDNVSQYFGSLHFDIGHIRRKYKTPSRRNQLTHVGEEKQSESTMGIVEQPTCTWVKPDKLLPAELKRHANKPRRVNAPLTNDGGLCSLDHMYGWTDCRSPFSIGMQNIKSTNVG